MNGDLIDEQLKKGKAAPGYAASLHKLEEIVANEPFIKYLYVYKVTKDGIFAVFDVDMPTEEGREAGFKVEDDLDISGRLDEFLAGGDIAPGTSNSEYGSLLTAYTPIYDSKGKTVAYACCDIETSNYTRSVAIYILETAAIILLATLLAFFFVYAYVKKHVTKPIEVILNHKRNLVSVPPEKWIESDNWINSEGVTTNDELEELYNELVQIEEKVSLSVKKQKLIEMADREKTEFISRMSHDMRTPMNGIMGMAYLCDDEDNVDVLHENINKIKASGTYLLGLINETLDYQKIESGQFTFMPETIQAGELLAGINGIIEPMAQQKGVTYIVDEEQVDLSLHVRIDPIRIKQILINVISNAVKFTPCGGTVEFAQTVLQRDAKHSKVKYTITDNGCGMSEDFIKNKLFKPFSQEMRTKTSLSEGTGLGLSIVKKLIELMDGEIYVESKVGKGTKFTIVLDYPVVSESSVTHEQADNAQEVHDAVSLLKGKNILLAEDHPLNTQIATKLLEKVGCYITLATNGQEAIDRFNDAGEGNYAVILMDLRMPVLGGLEAAKRIRALLRSDAKTIPIIALTANAYASDIKECYDAGMNAHVSKPFNPQVLYETIAKYV